VCLLSQHPTAVRQLLSAENIYTRLEYICIALNTIVIIALNIAKGGEGPYDALSCRFFAKEPLISGLFCGKWPRDKASRDFNPFCNVCREYIYTSQYDIYILLNMYMYFSQYDIYIPLNMIYTARKASWNIEGVEPGTRKDLADRTWGGSGTNPKEHLVQC